MAKYLEFIYIYIYIYIHIYTKFVIAPVKSCTFYATSSPEKFQRLYVLLINYMSLLIPTNFISLSAHMFLFCFYP